MLSLKSKYRTHTCGELTENNKGEKVILSGWINKVRNHGSLIFIDLRDNYGITQIVIDGENLDKYRVESVLKVEGIVVLRDKDAINPKLKTGKIEIKASHCEFLTVSSILPFTVSEQEKTSEDLRLKYRYIDLRREKLHNNILQRNKIIKFVRDFMWNAGFSEFQTPILTVSSPEGARDYIVPSRVHHGKFYALPQAPQQFKQLLQIGGFDRYFQIAPCFRDEDLRADRLLEFYQLDIEMSFVDIQDIQEIGNKLIPLLIKTFVESPIIDENILHIPFNTAIDLYCSDKPDLRNPIKIWDNTELFKNSNFSIFSDNIKNNDYIVKAIPAPAGQESRSWFDKLTEFAKTELDLGGLAYLVFSDDYSDAKGPIAKKLSKEELDEIKENAKKQNFDTVFFICEEKSKAIKTAGKLRIKLGEILKLINDKEYKLCWIEDFPFYELNEETGQIDFGHNPFSLPKGDINNEDPLMIKANQFDMVLNGSEICSGGLRNYNTDVMLKVFKIAGYNEKDVKEKFGGMYEAFQYGVPPHGGCAFGIDRIIQILLNEPNLREIVAFPTNQKGQDLMLSSPREVTEEQLREAHIQVRKKN